MSTTTNCVPYTPELEQPFPNEEELVRQVVAAMEHANEQVAAKHRHGLRDAHAKSHGVLAGELRVEPNLPDHLAQGLLAAPNTHPVIVRFSTAPGDLRSDQLPVQRGMAIKVLDAPGAATPTTSSRSTRGTRSRHTVRSARSCARAAPPTRGQATSATRSTGSSITSRPASASYPTDRLFESVNVRKMPAEQVPVLIVGGGGAGLAASMLLACQGVEHLLVSARPGTSTLPTARVLNQRARSSCLSVSLIPGMSRRAHERSTSTR